jgi:hypothetical protein
LGNKKKRIMMGSKKSKTAGGFVLEAVNVVLRQAFSTLDVNTCSNLPEFVSKAKVFRWYK